MFGLGKIDRNAKRKPKKRKEVKAKPQSKSNQMSQTPTGKRQHAKVFANPFAPKTTTEVQRASFVQTRDREIEIYVHVPFCVQKCLYCDFLSAPKESDRQVRLYMEDLVKEVRLMGEDIKGDGKGLDAPKEGFLVRSIFFGGGTPTSVPAELLIRVLDEIRTAFTVKANAEITLEANPGTVTQESLIAYRKAGINRLSLGVQSANIAMLRNLGRIHTFEEAKQAFLMARAAGFDNISVDLMSGLPHQSIEIWHDTIRQILALNPEHISAYSLIVEDGTPFYELYRGEGERNLPNEDVERQMYYDTEQMLLAAGYERYEISNYAKPGYECIHNLGYWTGVDYIGIGLGASSLWDRTRYQNVRKHADYHEAIEARDINRLHRDVQKLSRNECMEEHMFLGLRCMKGISKKAFEDKFGVVYETVCGPATNRLLNKKLIEIVDGDIIRLTKLGIDVSNQVFAEFLLDE